MKIPDVAIALDYDSLTEALALVDSLGPGADFYKVGLELYARVGPAAVDALRARGKRVFLDLKLHDIPNTVAGAVRAAGAAEVEMLTVHTAGGPTMMEAAAEAVADGGAAMDRAAANGSPRLRIVGVTVLTSLSDAELGRTWGRPVDATEAEVVRLAVLAREAGLDGVVASAREAAALRQALGPDPLVVTPGIRLEGGPAHDQVRVTTPADAARAGADCLVVGRAVTAAAEPRVALSTVHNELQRWAATAAAEGAPEEP